VVGFLVAVNALVFVLAFFLDFFEIAFIIIPLLAPVAAKLGIDLVWFGVLLGANMQTSFMHPPFGFALFYLRGIAPPEIKTSDIYWGALPWVGLQLTLVAILIAWPELVTGMLDHVEIITPGDAVIDIDAAVYDWGGFHGDPAGPRDAAPARAMARPGERDMVIVPPAASGPGLKPRVLVTRANFPEVLDLLRAHFEVEDNQADEALD